MIKKVGRITGDTLIEVTLAIGIFSMVAVAISAVMSSGVGNAQTALETTLAREEIDSQAEALRFIQSAYISDKDSDKNERYEKIWKEITNLAITLNSTNSNIVQFSPSSCDEMYNNETITNKAFVINPRKLKDGSEDAIVVKYNTKKLKQTSTYPRLVFGTSADNTDSEGLADKSLKTNLYRAEGIYVFGVKDQKTTNIVGNAQSQSAFYDFYIRTCWYGSGDHNPSTISTVIRLYDPDVVKTTGI